MDVLFIEFRDPLFGVIVFFILIFIIAFVSYWWGRIKTREDHRDLDGFIKQFHTLPPEEELQELISNSIISEKSWYLLAHAYIQNGEYEKSIEIYQAVLKRQEDPLHRRDTMLLLGKTYFKAGFLERSKSLFLKILQQHPRTPQALHLLLLVYEQLHEYDNAIKVLDPLDELDSDTALDRLYLECISLINDQHLSVDDKASALLDIHKERHTLGYLIFEYLFRHRPELAWQHFDQSQAQRLSDILWQLEPQKCDLDIISQNGYLRELFTAKGVTDLAYKSDTFELDVLIKLRKVDELGATLTYEYLCQECKNTLPFAFHRCPNCYAIDSVVSKPVLTKVHNTDYLSFQ